MSFQVRLSTLPAESPRLVEQQRRRSRRDGIDVTAPHRRNHTNPPNQEVRQGCTQNRATTRSESAKCDERQVLKIRQGAVVISVALKGLCPLRRCCFRPPSCGLISTASGLMFMPGRSNRIRFEIRPAGTRNATFQCWAIQLLGAAAVRAGRKPAAEGKPRLCRPSNWSRSDLDTTPRTRAEQKFLSECQGAATA